MTPTKTTATAAADDLPKAELEDWIDREIGKVDCRRPEAISARIDQERDAWQRERACGLDRELPVYHAAHEMLACRLADVLAYVCDRWESATLVRQ